MYACVCVCVRIKAKGSTANDTSLSWMKVQFKFGKGNNLTICVREIWRTFGFIYTSIYVHENICIFNFILVSTIDITRLNWTAIHFGKEKRYRFCYLYLQTKLKAQITISCHILLMVLENLSDHLRVHVCKENRQFKPLEEVDEFCCLDSIITKNDGS